MPTEKVKAVAEVEVTGDVYITVVCDVCDEKLVIVEAKAGERFQKDEVTVRVKPHTCKPEEVT